MAGMYKFLLFNSVQAGEREAAPRFYCVLFQIKRTPIRMKMTSLLTRAARRRLGLLRRLDTELWALGSRRFPTYWSVAIFLSELHDVSVRFWCDLRS